MRLYLSSPLSHAPFCPRFLPCLSLSLSVPSFFHTPPAQSLWTFSLNLERYRGDGVALDDSDPFRFGIKFAIREQILEAMDCKHIWTEVFVEVLELILLFLF